MAARVETPHPPKADVVLFKPIPRPEWRVSPPPFKGPHTEEAKTKNKISNTGQKRNPDFGPKISKAMVNVWKRDEYREKRKGIKRNHLQPTRDKISASLEDRWKNDEKYKSRMLKVRRGRAWKDRASLTLRKRWRKIQFAEEIDQWGYAEKNGLLPRMISDGYFNPEQLEAYRKRLFGDLKRKPFEIEMERFSIALLHIAS